MIAVAVCGAVVGCGLWLVWTGLRPARPDLSAVLARLQPTPPPDSPPQTPTRASGWAAQLGTPLARKLDADRLIPTPVRTDLITLGRDPRVHLAEKVVLAAAGLLLPTVAGGILALAGQPPPVPVPAAAALILTLAGFLAPDAAVRTEARRARRSLRHAFSAFLDLTVIGLAGGAGLEQALDDAASIGTGPDYTLLRHAVDDALLTGRPPWDSLTDLGARHHLPDIIETAASVHLAGGEGAKIRASLTARATTIRLRQLTDTEADAASATERMTLPVVLLFTGFLLLIGYPAVIRVLSAL